MHRLQRPAILALIAVAFAARGAAAYPGYLRFPDIHANRVVFTAEEDLWLTDTEGGTPRRITSHLGMESYARFSPDGKWIAFCASYDGNRDVYVMPAEGGEPRRLTWDPAPEDCIGWTPDGKKVIVRSYHATPPGWELLMVDASNGDPERLPIGWASRLAVDPASGLWAFNRENVENRTWKRYRGGLAPGIWVGDPKKADFRQVTDFTGTNGFPMWYQGRIYYLSDQGGTANIWSMKPDGSDRKQHTRGSVWDVRWPAMSPEGRIIYVLGADLWVWNAADGSERKLDIDLPGDRVLTRVRFPDPEKYMSWFALSPKADRIELVSRGEIFSVPVEKDGATIPVTHGSAARESWGSYDPKGERLAYVTDASGEQAIVTADAWGRGPEKVVKAAGTSGWDFPPAWSPDGKWIAWSDQTFALNVVSAAGDADPRVADRSDYWEIREYAWSPDGRWLAYTKTLNTDYNQVFVYDAKNGDTHAVTPATTDCFSPAWDPEGRYLYFLSARTVNPYLGAGHDFSDTAIKPTRPYLVLLRPDVENPFAALNGLPGHEESAADRAREKEKQKERDKGRKGGAKAGEAAAPDADEVKPVEIVFEGIMDRAVEVPVEAGNYQALGATSDRLFFVDHPIKGMADEPALFEEAEPDGELKVFNIEKKKMETFMTGVSGYELARKAPKIAVMKKKGEIYVLDTDTIPGSDLSDSKVSLGGVVLDIDPRAEWKQIFYEGWRLMRDFHWEPTHNGVDWQAVRDQYATLLPRVSTRTDLVDLMGEVIGELCNSHTYVWGGDRGKDVPTISTGLLGAEVARAGSAFQVTRIYHGDPADNSPAPLLEPGVDVKEGDYILAVNHRPFASDEPFLAALRDLAAKNVVLTVNTKPSMDGSRDVVVKPLADEGDIRYVDWVRRNREYVEAKTGGKIGYLHIPDMGTDGMIRFDTWYYPQLKKEGLIVDARWNGGGFVSELIVERLARKVLSFGRARGGGTSTYPARTVNGPFVVLTNEFAGSDGDIFPYAIQLAGLAPVIGKRTWGGVVGIRADKPLVDDGMLTQPEFAWWDTRQGWGLENKGVIPDVEVDDLPQDLGRGVDAQLDRAVEEVMKLHALHPPITPAFGPAPVKSREAFLQGGK